MAKKILVVEDDEDSRTLAVLVLKRGGFDTLEARDGDRAFSIAESHLPDLILMDLGLKGADGLTVAERLRGTPSTRAIPVVALTAYAGEHDRARALAAGFDGYITKPIDVRTFSRTVSSYLKGGGV